MLAAHERDGAERASVIASFADLEIAHVWELAGIHPNAGVLHPRSADQAPRLERRNELAHLGRAEEEVHLGKLRLELRLVALDHAPHGHHCLTTTVGLASSRLDERLDRLLLRRVDEPARVDDDDVGVIERRRELGAVAEELREVALAVDGILVAAKSDETDLHG